MGQKLTTLGLSDYGPITKSAIDHVRTLPENEFTGTVASDDLKSADVTVSLQKTWRNGWGLGWWGKVTVADKHKPAGATGIEVKKKL